jgi:hypothetical protein
MTRTTATLIAVLWAASIAAPTAAQTASVTVLRGAAAQPAGATGAVQVLRGAPIVTRPAPTPEEPRRYNTVLGTGRTLWLRHERTGRLTACRVEATGYVDVSVIRCTSNRYY